MTAISVDPASAKVPWRIFGIVGGAVIIVGVAFAWNVDAYLYITISSLIPPLIWLGSGARTLPILPIISIQYFVYYALPITRSDAASYDSSALSAVAAMVGAFLVISSIFVYLFTRTFNLNTNRETTDARINPIVFVGLTAGIIYYIAALSGNLNWLGPWVGLARAVVLTFASLSCYFLGRARASGMLVGGSWCFALLELVLLVTLSVSGLELGGATNALVCLFGYSVTAKRIPWIGVGVIFAVLAILHAGKADMRTEFSVPLSAFTPGTVLDIPNLMSRWVVVGSKNLLSNTPEPNSDLLARASLLKILLNAYQLTPDIIPYAEGETYLTLPSTITPRFLDPGKPISQSGVNFLSIRYGLQSENSLATTTIGWGLIAEAYANFGYWGVIVAAGIFGCLCGALMRLSIGVPLMSLPMFVAISGAVVLLDIEATFISLLVTLAQSTIGAFCVMVMIRVLKRG